MLKHFLVGLVALLLNVIVASEYISNEIYRIPDDPPCDSEVYCHGPLLHKIQMARIYPDSKTFVDMKMKHGPDETLARFSSFIDETNDEPTQEQIKKWVEENFDPPGSEFEPWIPTDWKKNPAILDKINDASLKEFASDLNNIWFELGRKMTADVANNPSNYSIIHVDHPVIIPGGRFLEFYYWDSYWIIRGLLISEMYSTAKGMLQNFLQIVQRFGFIPNGGRVYYSMRSQPPLLAAMIKTYVDTTKDYDFAKSAAATLESEFNFWMTNHTTTVDGHLLAKYGDNSYGPRPESYREDILTGISFETEEERQEHYSELKAAAESGMDFSSRWFIKNGTNVGDLTDLKTRSIIPVELNAILYWNAKIIAEFNKLAGNITKAAEFEVKAEQLLVGVNAVLWDDTVGSWLDYDLINSKRRNYFVPTNLSPLWMKCFHENQTAHITEKVLQYINDTKLDDHPGGVPNTLQHTGEQWDFPNVWPPMQHILIVGLDNLNDERTKNLASKWATRWVRSNYLAYQDQKAMYEKYLATVLGGHGGGGEYEVQKGFGWSNGVVLDLLLRYGSTLTPNDKGAGTPIKAFGVVATLITAVFMTLMATKIFG